MSAEKFRDDVLEVQNDLQRAEAALNMRRYDLAIELLQSLLKAYPANSAIYYTLARAFLFQKKLREAREAVREALRLDPGYSQAHTLYGNILSEQREISRAEAAYLHSLEIDPVDAYTHYMYAVLLIDKAKNLALPLMQADRLSSLHLAETHVREALNAEPEVAMHHGTLAEILGLLEHFDEAESEFQQALRLDPENVLIHRTYGWYLLMKRNRPEEAAEYLRQAMRLNPNDVNTQQLFLTSMQTKKPWYRLLWHTHFEVNRHGALASIILPLFFIALLAAQFAWETNLFYQVARDIVLALIGAAFCYLISVEIWLAILLRRGIDK